MKPGEIGKFLAQGFMFAIGAGLARSLFESYDIDDDDDDDDDDEDDDEDDDDEGDDDDDEGDGGDQ